MKEAKTRVVITICTDIAVRAMFQLLKCDGNPLKMKFRVTPTVLVPGVTIQNVTRAIDAVSLQAAENEDQSHSCPRQEKKDGRVLSLVWMKSR